MENEKLFCFNCGAEFDPKRNRFCSQCGVEFAKNSKKKLRFLVEDIEDIEHEPNPYEAMRFIGTFVSGLGWMFIIVGWASAVFLYGSVLALFREFIAVDSGPLFDIASVVIVVMVWAVITIMGAMVIAAGQFYLVLLDIRKDMAITSKMIKLFGLAMFEKKE